MENLKFLRERKGWSQQKLADELFISQQSVYKYENGLAYPSLETLRLMSKLFNVSIDYIVGNYSTAPTILSEAEKKLLKNFNLLNPKQQKIKMLYLKVCFLMKNRTCPKADPVFISKYINLLISQIRICRYQQLPVRKQLQQLSYQPSGCFQRR